MKLNFRHFSVLASIVIFSLTIVTSQGVLDPAFGAHPAIEDFTGEYDFVAGIHNEVTFKFRNGHETVNFPVFSTTSDMVENTGTSFVVEGVVGNNPHLHQALDEAYLYRMSTLTAGSAFDYEHRYFDIDVNVVQNEVILKSFEYNNCEIREYGISTLTDDYESYLASNTGFAVVNSIEFGCGGVHINLEKSYLRSSDMDMSLVDYGSLPFTQAEDVHTFLTFDFDHGAEKIESVIFTLTSGFDESDDSGASFQIITAVLPHPKIDAAIDRSQQVGGAKTAFNEDFDVNVEFVKSDSMIRGLDFRDCIVSGYDILTLRDGEEGYTGKRGFATAEILDVDCSGLTPIIPDYDKSSTPKTSLFFETHAEPSYNMGSGPQVVATFEYHGITEVVSFPEFYQGNLISKSNPTFELVGVPAQTPLLYAAVDDAHKTLSRGTGVFSGENLFDVNIALVQGHDVNRAFDYSKCRIVDYVIKTEHDLEESFYNGFALTNEFHFECLGYDPSDKQYHSLFSTEKANTESTKDYNERQRSTWGPNFRVS
ncbi:MAG: hypothetical protein ACE5Q4_04730 [Nitrosopumilus sp.]